MSSKTLRYTHIIISRTNLKLVFVVCVSCGQVSELLRESETVPHMLRRHKVLCHFDTTVQVVYLGEQECTQKKPLITEQHVHTYF